LNSETKFGIVALFPTLRPNHSVWKEELKDR